MFNRNLIRQIQKYECIYNPDAPGYDNHEYRQHVFDGIGKKIGVSGEYDFHICLRKLTKS